MKTYRFPALLLAIVLVLSSCSSQKESTPAASLPETSEAITTLAPSDTLPEESTKEAESDVLDEAAKYQKALALMKSGDLEEAYPIFLELGSYEDSDTYRAAILIEKIKSAEVFSEVAFGRDGASQEIIWIVLAKEHDRALLFSKAALMKCAFDSTQKGVDNSWENSIIRKSLNDSNALPQLFSEPESSRILDVPVIQDNGIYTEPQAENDTVDKLFILSLSEIKQYFPEESWPAYLKNCWIRTHAISPDSWLKHDGTYLDNFSNYEGRGKKAEVHPVIWLDLADSEDRSGSADIIGNSWTPSGTLLNEKAVYQRMASRMKSYPAGSYWGFDSSYQLTAPACGDPRTFYSMPSTACQGFAFLLSDAAFSGMELNYFIDPGHMYFNTLEEWRNKDHAISFSALKVGDIIGMENFDKEETTHAAVVLEKHEDHVLLAEGNAGEHVAYGRVFTKAQFEESAFEVYTRFPRLTNPADTEQKAGEWTYFGSTSNSYAESVTWLVSGDNGASWHEIMTGDTAWVSGSALSVLACPEYDGYLFRCAYTYTGGWYMLSDAASLHVTAD